MRRAGIWFLLSCKRYIRRVSFLVILLLLPVVTVLVRGLERKEGTEIRIGVYVEKGEAGEAVGSGRPGSGTAGAKAERSGPGIAVIAEECPKPGTAGIAAERSGPGIAAIAAEPDSESAAPLEWTLAQDLAERTPAEGMFRFYLCDSEEQLRDQVASRQAECGYVISANLREKLDAGDYKRCIRVYKAPSTVAAELSSEVVFSVLMARYDRELFQDYVERGEAFLALADQKKPEDLRKESGALYDAWMENGGTFRFEYKTVQGAAGEERREGKTPGEKTREGNSPAIKDSPQPSLFPVRGIVAVYVFVAGLYSAAVSLADERKGLFLALPAASRIPCQVAAMAGPVALAAGSGLLALASGGSLGTGQVWREIGVMMAYGAVVALFSWILRMVCRREEAVCCLIPFFLIGSLLFCPVIVDVGRYVPALAGVGRLFLPWYYLEMF